MKERYELSIDPIDIPEDQSIYSKLMENGKLITIKQLVGYVQK